MPHHHYFSFDAETDGLYGEAFAIGAAVLDSAGTIIETFSGVAGAEDVKSEWVLANSIPVLCDMPTFASRTALREAFWQFYMKWRSTSLILADVPYPVEAQLLRSCVEEDLDGRMYEGPYPLLDVASILYAKGENPLLDRLTFSGWNGRVHHPLDDAIASCLCVLKVMSRISEKA